VDRVRLTTARTVELCCASSATEALLPERLLQEETLLNVLRATTISDDLMLVIELLTLPDVIK
jgi:hypothetical protein